MDRYHREHYAIVNLCDERDYGDGEFPEATVLRYPFSDHHTPALAALFNFCVRAHQYLTQQGGNVMAVHCKAGKGRTGVMICRRSTPIRSDQSRPNMIRSDFRGCGGCVVVVVVVMVELKYGAGSVSV